MAVSTKHMRAWQSKAMRWLVFALAPLMMVAAINTATAQSFTPLGDLPGGIVESAVWNMTPDGSIIVGHGNSDGGREAYVWTSGTGMVGLGELPGGDYWSTGKAVSSDGEIVAGTSKSGNGNQEVFLWSIDSGMVGLGDLPGGVFDSRCWDMSIDGSIIVGWSQSANGHEAFRWTSSGGMVGIGDLPGGAFNSLARGISSDGSVIVGSATSENGTEAFVWTSSSGMIGLGELPGGDFFSSARRVSSNGMTVVGRSKSAEGEQAMRWTLDEGMVGLGDFPGGAFESRAREISDDGSTIIGYGNTEDGDEAFIWDEANGFRSVQDVLTSYGIDMTGWQLIEAEAISSDGTKIGGWATNPDGDTEAWIADMTPPPTPTERLVVVDSSKDDFFEYDMDVNLLDQYDLGSGNNSPKGAAADATGYRWVIDNDDYVYVYDPAGVKIGAWKANGLSRPEGIATDGTHLWIVDRGTDSVYYFANGSSLTSGSASATSVTKLKTSQGNKAPYGIFTDGSIMWVVNATRSKDRVYVYDMNVAYQGRWDIDSSNKYPKGIQIDSNGDVLIIDNSTDSIHVYTGAAANTSGSQSADVVIPLDSNNSNPQGITITP